MEEATTNSNAVSDIRSTKRNELKDLRNKQKENALCQKRIRLQEVSEYIQDVSLAQFEDLLLNLKKKSTVSVDVLRKIKNSCIGSEYIEAVFRNDRAFNCLLSVLIGNEAQKQLEAAACLINLACGSHKCAYRIAKAAGAYLVSFIGGSSYFLQDASAWAAGNIANDCVKCFDIIKSQGILPALLKALESPLPSVVQSVVYALNVCTRYEDPEIISLIQLGLPKSLLQLLEHENFNKSTFLDAAFALSNCCFLMVKYSLEVFDLAAMEKIIDILYKVTQCPNNGILVTIPLIRCLGFLSYNDKACELIATHDSFHKSIQAISKAGDCLPLIKELIWVLSNIAVSRSTISPNLYQLLIECVMPVLKTENSATLHVLYYLFCLSSSDAFVTTLLKQHEIFILIKQLSTSENSDISQATKIFLEFIHCK